MHTFDFNIQQNWKLGLESPFELRLDFYDYVIPQSESKHSVNTDLYLTFRNPEENKAFVFELALQNDYIDDDVESYVKAYKEKLKHYKFEDYLEIFPDLYDTSKWKLYENYVSLKELIPIIFKALKDSGFEKRRSFLKR